MRHREPHFKKCNFPVPGKREDRKEVPNLHLEVHRLFRTLTVANVYMDGNGVGRLLEISDTVYPQTLISFEIFTLPFPFRVLPVSSFWLAGASGDDNHVTSVYSPACRAKGQSSSGRYIPTPHFQKLSSATIDI